MITVRSFALCFSLSLLFACKSNKESAFFHAEDSHSGYYKTVGVKQLHGVKWSYKTGGWVFSSPVFSKNKIFIGSDDSSLYALY